MNHSTSSIKRVAVLVVFMAAAVAAGCAPLNAKEQKQSQLEKTAQQIGEALQAGRQVFLYFHSDLVEGSAEDIPRVEKMADEHGAEVVAIDAMELGDLRYSYGVEYVPSIFLVKPDRGVAGVWIVDFSIDQIEAALKSKVKPTQSQQQFAKGLKEGKPQLLFFMAKWCGYCRHTIPQVEKFQNDFSEDVNTVTINIDHENQVSRNYLVNGVPVVLLLDSNGVIRERTGYPAGYEDFKQFYESIGADLSVKKASAE